MVMTFSIASNMPFAIPNGKIGFAEEGG